MSLIESGRTSAVAVIDSDSCGPREVFALRTPNGNFVQPALKIGLERERATIAVHIVEVAVLVWQVFGRCPFACQGTRLGGNNLLRIA